MPQSRAATAVSPLVAVSAPPGYPTFHAMLRMLCAMACSGAALSSTRVEQLMNKLNEHVAQLHGRVELDSPPGFGECSRCGRDGPNDYNCCHAGGAWAGMCGDERKRWLYAVLRIIRGVLDRLRCLSRTTHKRSFKRPIGTLRASLLSLTVLGVPHRARKGSSERPFGTYYLKCLDLSTWTVHMDSPMDLGWRPPPKLVEPAGKGRQRHPRPRIEPRFIFWGFQGP